MRLGQPAGRRLPGAGDEAQLGHVGETRYRLGMDVTDRTGADDSEADLRMCGHADEPSRCDSVIDNAA
jgi:hypothetical protein